MKKYVKKFDEMTKRCFDVAEYTNSPEYTLQEVEMYKGEFYLQGHAPKPMLDEVKKDKLSELNRIFEQISENGNASCFSSLGFEINADEAANRNISNLIYALERTGQETVQFCAFDNTFHEVSLAGLQTMKLEIISHMHGIYRRKWELREHINAAETIDDVNAVEIDSGLDEEIRH